MTQRGRATGTTGRSRGGQAPRGGQVPRAQAPRGDLTVRRERLRAVIAPVVDGAGYDLEDLSVSRAGRRHVVRVIVDADGGINLDAVADVSRAVSAALDAAEASGGDIVAGEYQLEVSSPGVDRPLTLPRHWRRNVGRLVRVTVRGAGAPSGAQGSRPAGDRQVTGRVIAADDERVVLEIDDERTESTYAELGPGRVQVEFSRLDELPDSEDVDDDDDVEDEER
ncbi:ribosome maturation factor RimP [Micromonospora endophytica]|uniref:Ribosome maturation factor RimP n=1 Tax=Micromonospora endophytica TaxID=515350 RepID=A0A2W2CSL9_9ACTN|nr:ribosome maturation factor RimP [Micromonospora endophytica]PZF96224.1 ribosome maturation factor RimP [Micromonospora endophytica]RIW50338.1 ribosome maturation factor RimP [Micromonospora endophytica]